MQTIQQKIISNKLGLLSLAEELQNVSKACKVMGYSSDTFYRYKELKDEGGIDALHEKTRRKPNFKNRVDDSIESQVVKMAVDFPAFGQKRAANELRKAGIFLSPAGVRGIWMSNFHQCVPVNFHHSVPPNILDTVPADFHRVVPRQS